MSSNKKTKGTKEGAKPSLVSKLRFPEFRGAELWKDLPIASILKVRDERRIPTTEAPLFSLTIESGITEKTDRYNREFLVRDAGNKKYKLVEPNDIVYNPSNLRWGAINYSQLSHSVVVSPIYEVLSLGDSSEHCLEFIACAVMRGEQIRRFITKAQGTLVERIAVKIEDFLSTKLLVPPTRAEQQKIAECLSSADEVIAAQARKVDALKTHKKGLMQQLFPREGETQPHLRFPEFQNAGEWETKRVDERGNVLAGKALAVNAPGPLRPYLRTKNVLDGAIDLSDVLKMPMTDAEFSRFEILDGDILLNEGQSLELVGRASIYRGEFGGRCAMQNQLLRFRAFPSTCPEFAAQAFRNCQKDGTFASVATKTTSVAHLGSSRFSALELSWPSKLAEQQRIADCLTSLDALITAETQKLEAFRLHKKGLMQQLFPSPEETTL